MAPEAGVDEELFSFAWLRELEEENPTGEVVDVGDAKGREGAG
jgi:hypothetical protein